jgi:hypothetical protein
MKVKEYRFRKGSRLPVDKAKGAGKRLAELHNGNDEITPEIVLDDAKDRSSPLHGLFNWDNKTAAHQHRLWQARHLLRSVIVIYDVSPDRPPEEMHAYVKLTALEDEDRTPYYAMPRVLSDKDLRARLIAQALHEVEAWRMRYERLTELGEIFAAIDRLKAAKPKPKPKRERLIAVPV